MYTVKRESECRPNGIPAMGVVVSDTQDVLAENGSNGRQRKHRMYENGRRHGSQRELPIVGSGVREAARANDDFH